MTLLQINIPEPINTLPVCNMSSQVIQVANQRIEDHITSAQPVIHNFVQCDFQLFAQTLTWIIENYLLSGMRFCELGSGFGVATLLASIRGMESIGIEIEPTLVEQSRKLAERLNINSRFFCGSFIPRDITNIDNLSVEVEHVATHEDDIYEEIGLQADDFDLFFAFPWPGEYHFFEAIFESAAADGACLLTYRGRDGMNLVRKT